MDPQERSEIERRSREGRGPRIVSPEFVAGLERRGASASLIRAALRAVATNPGGICREKTED